MKTVEQIKAEVTMQVIEENRAELKEDLKKLESQIEYLFKAKIEEDVKDSLDIADTGCTNTSSKTKEQENRRFESELEDIKAEKEAIEKKLHSLDEFH